MGTTYHIPHTFATWLPHSVPSHSASSCAAFSAVGTAWPDVTKANEVAACPSHTVRAGAGARPRASAGRAYLLVRVGRAHLLVNGLDCKRPQGSHAPHPPALHGCLQPLPAVRKAHSRQPRACSPHQPHTAPTNTCWASKVARRHAMSYEWLRLPAGKAESANCQLTIIVEAIAQFSPPVSEVAWRRSYGLGAGVGLKEICRPMRRCSNSSTGARCMLVVRRSSEQPGGSAVRPSRVAYGHGRMMRIFWCSPPA